MASASYYPSGYGAVQNSYNAFMGGGSSPASPSIPQTPNRPIDGPVQYNTSLSNLRSQGDITNINSMGDLSPTERIQRMADKQYEKWAAGNEFRSRIANDWQKAQAAALGGMQVVRYDNYSNAGNGRTPYQNFMSNQGASGLLGGSTSPFGQRSQQWNNAIWDQNNAYQQAMNPVFQQFGVRPPNTSIQTLW